MKQEVMDQNAVALRVSMALAVDEGRQLSLETFVPRDMPLREINRVLDKVNAVADRVEARCLMRKLEKFREKTANDLKRLLDDRQDFETRAKANWQERGKRGEPKLEPKEQQTISTYITNIERHKSELTKLDADIADRKQVIEDGEKLADQERNAES